MSSCGYFFSSEEPERREEALKRSVVKEVSMSMLSKQ